MKGARINFKPGGAILFAFPEGPGKGKQVLGLLPCDRRSYYMMHFGCHFVAYGRPVHCPSELALQGEDCVCATVCSTVFCSWDAGRRHGPGLVTNCGKKIAFLVLTRILGHQLSLRGDFLRVSMALWRHASVTYSTYRI